MVNLRQRCLQGCVVDVRWVDLHSSSLSYSCGFDERPDVFGVAVCGGPERCVVRGGCASEAHAADADGKAGLHDGVAAKVILVDLADCEQRTYRERARRRVATESRCLRQAAACA